ncbi:hypothetical protein SELMODRAFT_73779 [Selaginella moellendorffii]|uniref:Pentacotripeptide-repeat region of PRORP domain-containing protein n=1 Tax=Selaginella moellendorffii TaxID=88036 RepID=D8QNG0_SELML|nr:hypothetical protein SELMODRAFT_73779 [Selaginella moellendorffii]
MPRKNVVSWTALMAAYARNGHSKEAVRAFRSMNLEGERPNEVTVVTLLQSISSISRNSSAGMVAAMAAEFPQSLLVGNAILSFYSKLGDLELAQSVFRAMPTRDTISFNAMIAGHAQNGRSLDALFFAREMRIEGIAPDSASFTSILWACGHAGLLREAWMEFVGMGADFEITQGVEHFACVADLLGRGGRVAEAEELVQSMPFEPDYVSWTGLLDACRSDSDRERARDAAKQMRALRPEKSSPYVLALF